MDDEFYEKKDLVKSAPKTYNEIQKLLLAIAVKDLLQKGMVLPVVPTPDRPMSLLLVSVYSFFKSGVPLHKKAAWREMGVEDIKTGRKYIVRAEELGLIESKRSTEDRRMELLFPLRLN